MESKRRKTIRLGNRVLLEQATTQWRRTEAEMILDLLRSQPIISADEARRLVSLRVDTLLSQELAMDTLLTPLTFALDDGDSGVGGLQ